METKIVEILLYIITITIIVCFMIIGICSIRFIFKFIKECFEENIWLGLFTLSAFVMIISLFLVCLIGKWKSVH